MGSSTRRAAFPSTIFIILAQSFNETASMLFCGFVAIGFIFATDVEKTLQQISVRSDDWDLQPILWIDSEEQFVPYHVTTVTYGLSCAPFLAIRVTLLLLEEKEQDFPLAASSLTTDATSMTSSGALTFFRNFRDIAIQLQGICQCGCFPLQKWSSNFKEALQDVTSESRPATVAITSDDPNVRLLGIEWNSTQYNFKFNLQLTFNPEITKRTVLSETASLFDPLGFISPVIITAKTFLEKLWLAKLRWDDKLPDRLQDSASGFGFRIRLQDSASGFGFRLRFRESLSDLSLISLPRWLHYSPSASLELHGFSDASQLAMSAAVYLRSTSRDGTITVSLTCSKTKVAPLKRLTIPRLELTAALLLSRLDSEIGSFQFKSLRAHLRRRIGGFISGKENPADCASRGLTPRKLSKLRLWWDGPKWLSLPSSSWPSSSAEHSTDCDLEQRPGFAFTAASDTPRVWDLLERYSSLTKLLRVTAMCQRAVVRFKRSAHSSTIGPLIPRDLEGAKFFWIRLVQRAFFSAEFRILSNGGTLHKGNSLAALTPFIDQHGTLRVGGRLNHSLLLPEAKHPPILPRTSRFTSLVISDAHFRTLHGGTQTTLGFLRQSYWILGGRAPIRGYILRCVKCARLRGLQAQQLMGQLPPARVTPSRAFLHSGLDYAGPFIIKTWRGRGSKTYKGYLAVFVCFATSAVHLELVTDYTSDAFIAAYRRFTGRRGICHTLHSDCGTNFVGADTQLRALFKAGSAEMNSTIISLTTLGTKWDFNPPAAPHMGGKWEAAVKSAKFHLRRVIGDTSLTYEEFTTLLAQVEAILNSRPLCPLSDDPEDTSPLTPGHFTIGEALTTVPEPSLTSLPETRLSRWQFLQAKLQHFWQRWSSEYLQRSLSISKWRHPSHEIRVGSLVLITDERLSPSRWPLARVIDLHPGLDGLTRVVTLRTATSTFKRPISKLAILPVDSSTTSVAEGGECVQDLS